MVAWNQNPNRHGWNEASKGDSRIVLHAGGVAATWDDVRLVPTPDPTDTWTPIPHAHVVEQVADTMLSAGLHIISAAYGLANGGNRFFGLLEMAGEQGQDKDHALVVGLRNSHDKSFPVKLACGSRVFVCDNLAFSGEVTVTRRHTAHVHRALPGLIVRAIGEIGNLRNRQLQRFDAYKNTALTDFQAHDLCIRALDLGVVAGQTLPKVLQEWRKPQHEDFQSRTMWSLFNAFTESLKAIAPQHLPNRTIRLHGMLDAFCGLSFLNGEQQLDDASVIDVETETA